MVKRKISLARSFILGVFILILGFAASFAYLTYDSLPESYTIPATVQSSSNSSNDVVTGNINKQIILSNDISIHFLELGNKYTGDCILIKMGETEILVDGGSKASSIPTIKSYLDEYVDGKLEYVVVTHAHEDHYAAYATGEGTNSLFDYYQPKTLIEFAQTNKTSSNKMYSNYLKNVEKIQNNGTGTDVKSAKDLVGSPITIESKSPTTQNIKFEILDQKYYYEENKADAKTENNFSVCFQISQGDSRYLFTGDLEEKGEESLVNLNQGKLGKVVVYKAGHHGSKTSSSEKLMSIIQPKVVCVCCCAGSEEYTTKNENQFPTQQFINNVYKYGSKIYVTSLCLNYNENSFTSFNGTIVVCATETTFSVQCSNNSTDLKDTDWFKKNRTLPNAA